MFNDVSIARGVVSLKNILVTSIGHATDVSLLDRLADQSFETPSLLGIFFNERAKHYTRREEEADKREATINHLRKENEQLASINRSLNEKLSGKDLALNSVWNGVEAVDKSVSSLSVRIIQIAKWHNNTVIFPSGICFITF